MTSSKQAAGAFKKALRETGLTQKALSAKTQISQTALTKFVTGRPLTTELVSRIASAFPEPQAKEIVVGYLIDEVARIGYSPNDFCILIRTPNTFVVQGDLSRLAGNSITTAESKSTGTRPDDTRDI